MSTWNDGGLPNGARKVKFYDTSSVDASGNSVWNVDKGIYILESFSPTRPQRTVKRYDESGAPNGGIGIDDFVEASAVVQLDNQLTDPVNDGMAFTTKRRGATGQAAAGEGFVVISADEPETQGDVRKQSVRLQKIVKATPPTVYP